MNRIGNLPVDSYSAICDDNTCKQIYCSVYPQLPPVIGATSGLLRARFEDLVPPSAMVRCVCHSFESVLCARVLLLHNVFRKI